MSLYNGLVEIFPLVPRKDVVLMVSEEEILSHLNIQGSCPYRSGKWKPRKENAGVRAQKSDTRGELLAASC